MIPLVVRSHYSLMWGTDAIPRLCRTAAAMGYRRLALTDRDNLYGLWSFLAACRRHAITPIVGAELTDLTGGTRAVCLVETATGYRNLCRLITQRRLQADFRLQTALPPLAGGLLVLTSDPGLLADWHGAGVSIAAAMPRRPLAVAHPLRHQARALGVPLVATPDSFWVDPRDVEVHRLLRTVDRNTTLSRLAASDVASADAWLASPAEYARRFAGCPEALRATHAVAERLAFTGPKFGVVLPPLDGGDAARRLRAAAYAGARRRYGQELSETVVERLEHELRAIAVMGFCAYFLIVRDIVRRSPRTCGRGSGAASLVAYCLGITNVCPLKHNLYFERFLNPGRTDPPDIDVDFAWDERDRVLQAVLAQHRGHAAMVANHVCMQPRMALREVAKVHGLTAVEIGRVSRRLPRYGDVDPDAPAQPESKTAPRASALDPPWPDILRLARRIVGTPRYLSVHPGGVVITPEPIDTYVPLERAPKGVPIIQWEKGGTEEAGLVKIDLLGNRSLGVVRDALSAVRSNGTPVDELRWEPEDDAATQEALAQGRTMGCFYIESPAMRLLQQKTGVGDFDHLVIHSSIIRPAANAYIREYVRRLHGGRWDPTHPLLADVLDETFGILVYQEDVSRAAVAVAGFSHAEADALRKVLSKKDREHRLRDFHARFANGARAKGVPDSTAAAVWGMMMSFDGYSFCKPHSASYARVSYQAAYLKVHHPAEFMAAVISNQGGFYSPFAYVSEARRMGLTIALPDVNRSADAWVGRDSTLRVGLLSVKGLSADTRQRIVAQRNVQPYIDVADFMARAYPADDEARALVHCGALDAFAPEGNRGGLLWELVRCRTRSRKPSAAGSLFREPVNRKPPPLPPDDPTERLRREFAVLGFLCDQHPMILFAERLRRTTAVKVCRLPSYVGRRVQTAGWLITGKVVRTKHGEPMEFLTFEDETGIVETTFFPEAYRRFSRLVERRRPYLLTGKVEQDWGAITLTVEKVQPLA